MAICETSNIAHSCPDKTTEKKRKDRLGSWSWLHSSLSSIKDNLRRLSLHGLQGEMSQLTYRMKPTFHPENCRQPKEEQTCLVQSGRSETVTTALVFSPEKLTDIRDPPLALATVSFSFSAARRWTAWKLLRAAEKSLISRSLWIFCCLWRSRDK